MRPKEIQPSDKYVYIPNFVLLKSPKHRWDFYASTNFKLVNFRIIFNNNVMDNEPDFIQLEVVVRIMNGTKFIRSIKVVPGLNQYPTLDMDIETDSTISIERTDGNDRLNLGMAFTMKIKAR